MSSLRNEVIADMFARLDVIEKAGTGIIRIREAMEAENLQPQAFEDKGEFFKIILYRPKGVSSEGGVQRNVTTNVPRNVTINVPRNVPRNVTINVTINVPRNVTTNDSKELNKTQLAILELVKKEHSITISEIASILNLADRTIKRSIDFLKKSGLIQRIGTTKSGHWAVTDRSRK
jgi:predicted HTH transcriptional regulator